MRPRGYNLVGLVLALLLFGLSVLPTPGRAEAQMRCAGASAHAMPCARVEVTGDGLTEKQVSAKLMACCRVMRGCSMPHDVSQPAHGPAARAAHRCLVTIHLFPTNAKAPGVARNRWLLTASPALAPPRTASALLPPALFTAPARTDAPALSLQTLPHRHGLRAPPAA